MANFIAFSLIVIGSRRTFSFAHLLGCVCHIICSPQMLHIDGIHISKTKLEFTVRYWAVAYHIIAMKHSMSIWYYLFYIVWEQAEWEQGLEMWSQLSQHFKFISLDTSTSFILIGNTRNNQYFKHNSRMIIDNIFVYRHILTNMYILCNFNGYEGVKDI